MFKVLGHNGRPMEEYCESYHETRERANQEASKYTFSEIIEGIWDLEQWWTAAKT